MILLRARCRIDGPRAPSAPATLGDTSSSSSGPYGRDTWRAAASPAESAPPAVCALAGSGGSDRVEAALCGDSPGFRLVANWAVSVRLPLAAEPDSKGSGPNTREWTNVSGAENQHAAHVRGSCSRWRYSVARCTPSTRAIWTIGCPPARIASAAAAFSAVSVTGRPPGRPRARAAARPARVRSRTISRSLCRAGCYAELQLRAPWWQRDCAGYVRITTGCRGTPRACREPGSGRSGRVAVWSARAHAL
jgi:hypothetical protein